MGRKSNPPIVSAKYTTPSEMIYSKLGELNMTQVELAIRCGMSKKHINDICRGHARISPDVALKFEMIFGISARRWNEAQVQFDLDNVMDDKKSYSMKNIRKTEPTEVTYVYDDKNRLVRVYLQLFYRTVFQARKVGRKFIIATLPVFHSSNGVVVKSVDDIHRHMNEYIKWVGAYAVVKVMGAIREYDDGKLSSPNNDDPVD